MAPHGLPADLSAGARTACSRHRGGAVAARKAELLLKCGRRVLLVAPELAAATQELLRQLPAAAEMSHLDASFAASHLDGAALVIAATDCAEINAQVSSMARARGIPVNVADNAELSDFILPAIVDRSPVVVAVSSAGTSPVLARRVREQIEALLPAGLGALAHFAGGPARAREPGAAGGTAPSLLGSSSLAATRTWIN